MADYQFTSGVLANLGVSLFALCTDAEDKAKSMVERNKITYPVMYGVDGPATAETLGAYYEERRNIVQPTAFILNPDHKIVSLTYATGPAGRLMAQEAAKFVDFVQKRAAEAAKK